MYTLKTVAKRGTAFGVAAAMVVSTVIPTATVLADALNPLTERSLLLTSSAPGFQDTDGSGNSTQVPNPAAGQGVPGNYAPAGSGANGRKTGQTFTFRVSTDSTQEGKEIKAFTLQYCREAAGKCKAPGNNDGDARAFVREADGSQGAEREPNRQTNDQARPNGKSDLDINYTAPVAGTDFRVLVNNTEVSTGWSMATSNVEDFSHSGQLTGKRNFITLTHETGITPTANTQIQVIFNATETNHITNPGADAFFVKMNTFNSDTTSHHVPGGSHNIDGGVTVANVMTDSIHITTKVLETMSFSVGTRNRDTTTLAGNAVHGTCDPIEVVDANRLNLGNPDAEYSLETDRAWDVNSYWRLSSNSSGGATVYYSGNTLANTVGDEIREIGAAAAESTPGTEQFGLAFVDATADDTGRFSQAFLDQVAADSDNYRMPTLTRDNLAPVAAYANGTGSLVPGGEDAKASFAFLKSSNTVPQVIAANNSNVISCATAKMRYIGNIGADTPAGVYTTKINYLAAPQY